MNDELDDVLAPVVPEPEMVSAGELIEASQDRAALARRWDAAVRAHGSHESARAAEPKLYGLYYDFVLRPHRRPRRRPAQNQRSSR